MNNIKIFILISIILNSVTANEIKKEIEECNKGNIIACGTLGYYYEKTDKEKSIYYHKKTCETGLIFSCAEYSIMTRKMINMNKVNMRFIKECNKENALSCYFGGKNLMELNHLEQGVKMVLKSCNLNMAKACTYLGIKLIPKNLEEALKLMYLGCEKKDQFACETLSKLNKSIDENLDVGCKKGLAEECSVLGQRYLSPERFSIKRYQTGIDLINKACNIGHKEACTIYENIKKVVREDKENTYTIQ